MSGERTDEVILTLLSGRSEFENLCFSGEHESCGRNNLWNIRDVAQLHRSRMVFQHQIGLGAHLLQRTRFADDNVVGHGIGVFKNEPDTLPRRHIEDFLVEEHLFLNGLQDHGYHFGFLTGLRILRAPTL